MRRLLGLAAAALGVALTLPVIRAQTPDFAGPLTYEQALQYATTRNLALQAARRQRAIREAAIRTARQAPNPSAAFDIGRDTPHEIFTVDLPIELGGRRSRRIDLAKEELTLADVDVQVELRAVRRELRQSFYTLMAADERVRLAESVVDISRRVRDAAQARFDTGAAPRLEVMQAELGVTRAETDLDLARSIRAAAQAQLNAVLNLPPDRPLTIAGTLGDRIPAIAFDQALGIAVASNTDLVALDREIAIEAKRLDLLRAERVPTPSFSVSGLFDSQPEFASGARAGVSLELPLFSRNQGVIAESVATTAQLRTKREATRRAVENDVYGTLAKIEAQRRQVDAYQQRLVPTATSLESLAEESYRAGRTSVLALLDAQRSLRELTRDALQASLDLQLTVADLEDILGAPIQ